MIKDGMKASGELRIVVKDKDGNVKVDRKEKNLVVTAGLGYIADRMKNDSGTTAVMSHMAVGSDNTAAAAGQTDLLSILGSREALDSTTVTGSSVEYIASFEAGEGTGAIVEAGIFNASTGGTMLCRTVFSTVNKAASDTMTITWTITLSAV